MSIISRYPHPLVSVVIPTFNRSATLQRCIDSVLQQTYKNWELFVVDDGSSDNTHEVVSSYIQINSNIRLIKRPESRLKGANACRNIGINCSKGDWVALLDSDDEWLPNHLESNISTINLSKNFSGLYGGALIDKKDSITKVQSRPLAPNESDFDFLLSADGFAQTSSFFLSCAAAKTVLFDEELKRHQDWDFFIRFGKKWVWGFNPDITVKVHWEKGVKREVNFDSCIEVYNRHQLQLENHTNKALYLTSMLEAAIKYDANKDIVEYYKNELKECNIGFTLRHRLIMNFPKVFYYLHKIKNI